MAIHHLARRRVTFHLNSFSGPTRRPQSITSNTPCCSLRAGYSTTSPSSSTSEQPVTAILSSRWLSDLKKRIGKCIIFGLDESQMVEAGRISKEIGRDWRELVAGSEGFLTGKDRRGLYRQAVIWGEMSTLWVGCNDGELGLTIGRQGHVNNVTYVRYAESARVNWANNIAYRIDPAHRQEWTDLTSSRGDGMILRSIRTDYKFPMTWPDRVTVYHKLRSAPSPDSDAFVLDVIILSELHQRCAARCVEDIVVYDYRQGRKMALRPFMHQVFSDTFRRQQEAQSFWTQHVRGLIDRVEGLEKASWDRAGATEDFGSVTA